MLTVSDQTNPSRSHAREFDFRENVGRYDTLGVVNN
jgi:hypothetical protein